MVLNPAFIFVENKSFTLCVRLPIYLFPFIRLSRARRLAAVPAYPAYPFFYSLSFATNNASGLMLSNCVPKYMVATYDTRNGSYFSISTFSSESPLP